MQGYYEIFGRFTKGLLRGGNNYRLDNRYNRLINVSDCRKFNEKRISRDFTLSSKLKVIYLRLGFATKRKLMRVNTNG